MQNARAGIPNRVAQGIRTGGGSWPHAGIVGATSGIAPGGTPASAMKPWLRSAVGERGKWSGGGEEGLAERSRSATPAAGPQTEARRSCGPAPCKLVTSARFEKQNGRRREAYERRAARAVKQTARWSRQIRADWDLPMVNSNAFFLSLNWRQNQAAGPKLPAWKR